MEFRTGNIIVNVDEQLNEQQVSIVKATAHTIASLITADSNQLSLFARLMANVMLQMMMSDDRGCDDSI